LRTTLNPNNKQYTLHLTEDIAHNAESKQQPVYAAVSALHVVRKNIANHVRNKTATSLSSSASLASNAFISTDAATAAVGAASGCWRLYILAVY
jgi:hypothetical protein